MKVLTRPRPTEEQRDDRPNTAGPWRVRSLGFEAPGRTAFFGYDEGELPEDRFRVRTRYTGLSAGTELTHFRGTNQYLHKTWDDTLKVFRRGAPSQQYPLQFSGYMEVGEVCASRCDAVREGEVVAMAYGHKTGHTADPLQELFVPLPAGLDPVLGIYVAQMGPICANAILHADEDEYGAGAERFGCGVEGRSVLVFGSGVIGLLTAMMARWCGAAEVAVADTGEGRLGAARGLGLLTVDTAVSEPAAWAKARWGTGPGARTAARAGQTWSSSAGRRTWPWRRPWTVCAPRGRRSTWPSTRAAPPLSSWGRRSTTTGCATPAPRSPACPRKLQHAWNRHRLSEVTLRFLLDCGGEVRRHLVTDVVPLARAQQVFERIAEKRAQPLQVVFCADERDALTTAERRG